MTRILIAGPPKAGKTTLGRKLADELGITLRSTDDLIGKVPGGWSAESEAVSFWLDEPGSWIIEGVSVGRALRKWLKRSDEQLDDVDIHFLSRSLIPLVGRQIQMASDCVKHWNEIKPELKARGARIVEL